MCMRVSHKLKCMELRLVSYSNLLGNFILETENTHGQNTFNLVTYNTGHLLKAMKASTQKRQLKYLCCISKHTQKKTTKLVMPDSLSL